MREKALAAARKRLNVIAPIDIPTTQSEPESAEYTEEKQTPATELQQGIEAPCPQDFWRRSA